jgi:hypothetical protein
MIGCLLATALSAGCETGSEPVPQTVERNNEAVQPLEALPRASINGPGAKLGSEGGPVELEKITLTAPPGWERREASSGFVLAELYLPKPEGAEADARLTVSVAGGDVEANIERWRTQFGGKPEKESQRKTQADGLEVVLVDFSGEYNDQRGPHAPATKRPGSRMLAAIIPVGGELYFVKAVGPEPTIAAHAEAFEAFVHSVKQR